MNYFIERIIEELNLYCLTDVDERFLDYVHYYLVKREELPKMLKNHLVSLLWNYRRNKQ